MRMPDEPGSQTAGATAPAFGSYLRHLIARAKEAVPQEDWTLTAIAEHCNLPRTALSRWLHGHRPPALNSGYAEKLAACLGASPEETRELEQAQVRSLKAFKKPPRPRRTKDSRSVGSLPLPLPLLPPDEAEDDAPSTDPGEHGYSELNRANTVLGALPKRGGPIQGRELICHAAIELLQRAPALDPHMSSRPAEHNTILVTSQAHEELFISSQLRLRWQRALRAALQKGYNVQHLLRLDRDPSRSLRIAKEIIAYLGYIDSYTPYVVPQPPGTLIPPYEMLVVPNAGTLFFVATEHTDRVDAAIYSPGNLLVHMAGGHFAQLQGHPDRVRPILKRYKKEFGRVAFLNEMAEAEQRPGDRFLIKDGLSAITRPLSFCDEQSPLVQAYATKGESAAAVSARHIRRIQAFEKWIRRYRYRDVCTQRAILTLVREGRYTGDDLQIPETYVASLTDRLAHLHRVRELLMTYDNYELALVDEEQADRVFLRTRTSSRVRPLLIVKADQVLFETWSANPEQPGTRMELDVVIKEPTIAAALHAHVADLWETQIARRNSEKSAVIQWLEERIEELATQRRAS